MPSDSSSATVTVVLSGTPSTASSVLFATSDGTATNGVNYQDASTTLEFAASGISSNFNVFITIPILGGVPLQSTQTVNLTLSNPVGPISLGNPSTNVLQIINTNSEAQSTVALDQSAYTNDDTDPETDVTLLRTGDDSGTITVKFNTQDGSAIDGVDYTALTTNVEFDPGVDSIPLVIPLLAPSGCESNKNFTLVLSNPSSGAVLGAPSRATVTILATGATTIQLSAANINVHEHAGRATVIATRCGDSSAQATVDYATSDGTARSGVDYLGTSGTLIFPAGVSTAGFSFQITGYSTFQSNKTVNVALSNPSAGATLADPSTATVTIVNDRPQTITFTNSDGSLITLMLKSVGTMLVTQNDPLDLYLDSTEASTTITMKLKASKTASAPPQIDEITGNGDCGLIDASGFDVTGAGILLDGYLKQLRIHDIDGAEVDSNGSAKQGTSISAHNIDDDSVINVANRILRVQAARFGSGASLSAEQIGSFSIKGDKKNGLSGDCLGSIEVFGDNLNSSEVACGSIKAAGAINGATISIDNGSMGAMSAKQMIDSTLYVGYTPKDENNPISGGGTFIDGTRLGSVSLSLSSGAFIGSDIAAAQIGSVRLGSIVTDNGGVPFGITAEKLAGVSSKNPAFRFDSRGPRDQSLGDFHALVQ
ncbi:MAG TPA: Calx-beta domain-containing protein [Verrucomicrobiae bacterium]|nr:Calx-beta domain-containing protein [Verrucomicrobiae bacterium]